MFTHLIYEVTSTNMPDKSPYSNRELDQKFVSHEERMNARFDSTDVHLKQLGAVIEDLKIHLLEPTLEQAKKTNGRVNALENWKFWAMGAIGIITVFFVPLFGYVLYQVSVLPQTVHSAVAEEFTNAIETVETK